MLTGGQGLDQFLLLAVANADFHARPAFLETGDQTRQVQRRDGFEAADIDLPGDHVVVRQRVLLEFVGDPQQFQRLAVEARAARRQRNALGVVADKQLHAEAFFQVFDGRRHRRLGDVELARSLRHAAALGGGDEIAQLSQVISGHADLLKKTPLTPALHPPVLEYLQEQASLPQEAALAG